MRTAIYTRVSTEEQSKEGVSLDNQLDKCRLQCQLNDYEIIGEFVDQGKSAKNLNRPGIQEILKLVNSKSIEALVIYKLDRLTRNVSDLNNLIEMLNKKGVELVSVKDSLNTSTASGRMVINMLGTISQWERETIGERTQEALQYKKANNQKYTGITPYGFSVEGKTLVPNVCEKGIIDKIINLRNVIKLSYQKIADWLNGENIPTRMGGIWKKQTVLKIFNDNYLIPVGA